MPRAGNARIAAAAPPLIRILSPHLSHNNADASPRIFSHRRRAHAFLIYRCADADFRADFGRCLIHAARRPSAIFTLDETFLKMPRTVA